MTWQPGAVLSVTSPRLRGEADCANRSRVRGAVAAPRSWSVPLTATLSPQAGRVSTRCAAAAFPKCLYPLECKRA